MTRTDLFVAFGNVNEEYRSAAIKSMQTKPLHSYRPRLRYAIIAATLVLLVALIPIAVILANHTPTPPPPVTTPLPDPPTPSTHLSITDIPGAVIVSDFTTIPGESGGSDFMPQMSMEQRQKWVKTIKENYSSVLGNITDIESIKIETEDGFYHITRLTLKVKKTLYNVAKTDTITAIYATEYLPYGDTYRSNASYHLVDDFYCRHDMGWLANFWITWGESPTGVVVMEPSINHELSIQGKSYSLSDYADYYMVAYMRYEGEGPQQLVGMDKCGGFPYEWLDPNIAQ